jgi:hypothetical protein
MTGNRTFPDERAATDGPPRACAKQESAAQWFHGDPGNKCAPRTESGFRRLTDLALP